MKDATLKCRVLAPWAVLLCCCALVAASGCQDDEASTVSAPGDGTEPSAATLPEGKALPPLELRDDTGDLLLTWIDDKGDFHVVQKIADVPTEGRDRVRVVITTQREGTEELLYVADLRKKRDDGTYPVETMARSAWDALGASKRKKRLEALAPSVELPEPEAPRAEDQPADGKLRAIIYGADWCRPCHQAENLLKQLGVDVTKKDIEADPAAGQEMHRKLRKAGRSGGSIPVIDLGGKVFVGFDARALRRAVEARRTETL